MKHAFNFKVQALKNLNLYKENPQQHAREPPPPPLDYCRIPLTVNKETEQTKNLLQGIDRLIKATNLEPIDDLEDVTIVADSGTTTTKATGPGGIFSYTQTSFEEDDITQLDIFQSDQIGFSLPETFKERKCMSCRRRFMFEDSYNEHIKECIQVKLMGFIREVYQLLCLKENRCISSHEFIRRVIFAIKKSVQVLVDYDNAGTSKTSSGAMNPLVEESPPKPPIPSLLLRSIQIPSKSRDTEMMLLSNSESDNFSNTSNASSPLIFMRCQECNSNFENLTDLEMHNFQNHNQSFNGITSTMRRNKAATMKPQKIDYDTESSAAEMNNHHIPEIPKVMRKGFFSSIKMWSKNVDVITNNLCDESEMDENIRKKLVKCSKCDEAFQTISHLDLHVAKKHSKSPLPVV